MLEIRPTFEPGTPELDLLADPVRTTAETIITDHARAEAMYTEISDIVGVDPIEIGVLGPAILHHEDESMLVGNTDFIFDPRTVVAAAVELAVSNGHGGFRGSRQHGGHGELGRSIPNVDYPVADHGQRGNIRGMRALTRRQSNVGKLGPIDSHKAFRY